MAQLTKEDLGSPPHGGEGRADQIRSLAEDGLTPAWRGGTGGS